MWALPSGSALRCHHQLPRLSFEGRQAGRQAGSDFVVDTVADHGFPGGASGKESTCPCRRRKRRRFDLSVRKIPWKRAWKPTWVFLPGKSHGQMSLASYSPWGRKASETTKETACMQALWQIKDGHTFIDTERCPIPVPLG